MNYQEALDYLYSFIDSEAKLPRLPVEFNLPRTGALLTAFGEPQKSFPSVVVAGTKGKGSTSVMIEAMARAAGYRVGLWTSPHLHSYRERMQVNRVPISRDELVAYVQRFQPTIGQFDVDRYGTPSVFDLSFAIALRYFADQNVDLAVLEVGLGGRYDSANAVTPVVSVITSISYDHMQVLGDTLAKIAYQKAGIAKAGVPLITLPQPPEAMQVIEQVAREVGAPLALAERAHWAMDGRTLVDDAEAPRLEAIIQQSVALRGSFQRENARVAVGVVLLLREQGWHVADAAMGRGLADASWPGRVEVVPGEPPVVLDGAHNGDSAQRLVEALQELFPNRRLVLVFGTTRDKDVAGMFDALLPAAHALVLTHSRHPRAESNVSLLRERAEHYARSGRQLAIDVAEDVPEALEKANSLAGPHDVICVTGSLFVVAAAREALGLPHERD